MLTHPLQEPGLPLQPFFMAGTAMAIQVCLEIVLTQ
jgi:hypothetical protein